MEFKLKKARDLYEDVKISEVQKNNVAFEKCVNTINTAANKGMYHAFFNETLCEVHLDELKKMGYGVEPDYDYDTQHPEGRFCGYTIKWDIETISKI